MTVGTLARWNRVRSRQREIDHGVIECRRSPGDGRVALGAVLGEVRGNVIGVGGPLKILEMAGNAGRTREVVIIINVAVRTLPGRNRVGAAQRKPHRRVIEIGIEPVVGAVTLRTVGRKLAHHVIGVDSFLVIRRVAGITVGRHSLEFAVGSAFVAAIAVDRGMRTGQRHAIVVRLNLLDRHLPSPDRMALFTGRP